MWNDTLHLESLMSTLSCSKECVTAGYSPASKLSSVKKSLCSFTPRERVLVLGNDCSLPFVHLPSLCHSFYCGLP